MRTSSGKEKETNSGSQKSSRIDSNRRRQTPPSPIGGSVDLSHYIKKKTRTKNLYKYKGNYANQANKVKKLVHWAKVRGRDP